MRWDGGILAQRLWRKTFIFGGPRRAALDVSPSPTQQIPYKYHTGYCNEASGTLESKPPRAASMFLKSLFLLQQVSSSDQGNV